MINKVFRGGKLYGFRYGNTGKVYTIRKYGLMGAMSSAEKRGRAVRSSGWQAQWNAKYTYPKPRGRPKR